MEIINGKYPVIGTNPKEYVPYEVLVPHEKQALRNHRQTLAELADRGGLDWYEILCVLEDSLSIYGIRAQDMDECKKRVWKHIMRYYNYQYIGDIDRV